jgi:Mg-chelatase subunit ChlI
VNTQKQYPFTAIVGQELMKKALVLNLINPKLGGVLIRGEKGTAKSTAVRALAELMEERGQAENCPFNCDPEDPLNLCESCREKLEREGGLKTVKGRMRVVDLPVSATEDRVVGTLDIEEALKRGEKKFEPGILAQANRNILYVDEINLLDDHVVDVLLDSAAMGVNSIEREGISFSHPARFILVGTMNPEEGDLRPQLLDRFGLVADVAGERSVESRTEVVKRRLAYENDPEAFCLSYESEQKELRNKINKAKRLLPDVEIGDAALRTAAEISIALNVDGHRSDITMVKTAAALAAFSGATRISRQNLLDAARLALPHRLRRQPFEEGEFDFGRVGEIADKYWTDK